MGVGAAIVFPKVMVGPLLIALCVAQFNLNVLQKDRQSIKENSGKKILEMKLLASSRDK